MLINLNIYLLIDMVYGTWYIYTIWCRFLCVELLLNFVQRCKMQKLEKCNKNNENENGR